MQNIKYIDYKFIGVLLSSVFPRYNNVVSNNYLYHSFSSLTSVADSRNYISGDTLRTAFVTHIRRQ